MFRLLCAPQIFLPTTIKLQETSSAHVSNMYVQRNSSAINNSKMLHCTELEVDKKTQHSVATLSDLTPVI